MSEKLAPNPFTSAKRTISVSVMLRPADIIDVWHSLSVAEAERLFTQHGSTIAVQMLAAGINAAVKIIKQEGNLS